MLNYLSCRLLVIGRALAEKNAPRNGGMAGADAYATRERKKTND
jgi:hypothetical protein